MLEFFTDDIRFIIAGLGIIWGLVISLLAYRHLHDSAAATPHLFASLRSLRRRFGLRGAKLAFRGGLLVYFGVLVSAVQIFWKP
jgi:hypothetical protein